MPAHPQLLAGLAGPLEDAVHVLLRLLLEHARKLLQHARRGGRGAHLPAREGGKASSGESVDAGKTLAAAAGDAKQEH